MPLQRSHSLLNLPAAEQPHWLALNYGSAIHIAQSHHIDSTLVDNRGGDFEQYRKNEKELKGMKKPLREFYESQNELLDMFAEVDEILDDCVHTAAEDKHTRDLESAPLLPKNHMASHGREEAANKTVNRAINVNLAINVLLLAAKIFVVLLTNSVSLIASTIDSAMDLLSTLIIFFTSRWIAHTDSSTAWRYPAGKKRLEPMGIIVFSVFMQASFIQVLIESVQRIADKNLQAVDIPRNGLIIMGATVVIKFAVWLAYRSFQNSSVKALAQDAQNDVVFNIMSIVFPVIGNLVGWPKMDPAGGVILSIYIIIDWSQTLYDNVVNLAGRRASPAAHQRVIYLVTRFSPLVKQITQVSVYSAGDNQVVECDIILPRETPLPTAHNCGESIQLALESLSGVERAYIHLDDDQNPGTGHLVAGSSN